MAFENNETAGSPESSEFDSPNLQQLKQVIARYEHSKQHPSVLTWDEAVVALVPLGVKPEELISRDGSTINQERIIELFRDLEYRREPRDWLRLDEEEGEPGPSRTPEEEFKTILLAQTFIEQMLEPDQMPEFQEMLRQVHSARKTLESRYVHLVLEQGDQLFAADASESTDLPQIKQNDFAGVDKQDGARIKNLKKAFEKMAMQTADPVMSNAYQKLIEPLELEEKQLGSRHNRDTEEHFEFGSPDSYRHPDYSYSVKESFSREGWAAAEATPEQTHRLYDLLSEKLFSDLYRGGYESWPGTTASFILGTLRDPRAIPGMIHHLRRSGSGHTSANVAGQIGLLVTEPLSQEELQKVITGLSPVEQRVAREWYQDPDSWVQKNHVDGYGLAGMVQNAEKYLIFQDLASIAIKVAAQQGITLDEDGLRSYRFGNLGEWAHTQQIDEILKENPAEVAPLVARSQLHNLREINPQLFRALANPKGMDYFFFPQLIASEALGLEPVMITKLEQFYRLQDLRTGAFNREILADGLFYLASRPDGKRIIEGLLALSGDSAASTEGRTPAKRDPARLRAAIRMVQTIDRLDIAKRWYGHEIDFDSVTNLKDVVDQLRERTAQVVSVRMELGEAETAIINQNLEKFLESDLFEIVPSLLNRYGSSTQGNYLRPAEVAREVGRHVILGDFQVWRNGLETGLAALSILPTEESQAAWLNSTDIITARLEAQSDKEMRQAALEAIKRVASEAKAHILEVYKLDFSPDRLRHLALIQADLVKEIKAQQDPDQKRELGIRKRSIDAEFQLLQGLIGIQSMDPGQLDPKRIMELSQRAQSAMKTFEGLEQPIQDLEQIELVFTTQKELGTVGELRAYDSDDPMALLKSGTEPRETCQSWRQGSYNQCLPATVADLNKRLVNVENERGEVVGRSLIKLTHIRMGEQQLPAILMEPIYTTSELAQVYRLAVQVALNKARATGSVLIISRDNLMPTGADHTRTVPILSNEAQRQGFTVQKQAVDVFTPRSFSSHEYSDTLGGDITYFDRYVSLNEATIASLT